MEVFYPTPHINAVPEDFAKTVLMPGDPLRSKYIAENFLTDSVLINNVRGIQGYTGIYDGEKISVMASGMGMPSMGIYSYELYNIFGVENIIRIGSAGGLSEKIKVRDIVIAMTASTNSDYERQFSLPGHFSPCCDFGILKTAAEIAEKSGIKYHIGNIFTSDNFYDDSSSTLQWSKMGVLAVEMETAALYMNAARSGKKALSILTVSDNLVTGEITTAKERETSFSDMIELALKTAKGIS